MPKTVGGIVSFVLSSLLMFMVATVIINRVGFLRNLLTSASTPAK